MKRFLYTMALGCLVFSVNAQNRTITQQTNNMKLNAGVITTRLAESRDFYTRLLGFGVTFENEFYLLLHTPGREAELSFLLPDHPSQQPLFHKAFTGQGMYLTLEVDDVDKLYTELQQQGVVIKIELRDEPWGDRHFAIEDPNGIGIDIVTYAPPAAE
jgi:catechol 2,3-dioxygenase-like lactoylglutathione lyase family enzyme